MREYEKKETCCGCGACREICPQKAIQMIPDREGFLYPKVNSRLCSNCGKCRNVCPTNHYGFGGGAVGKDKNPVDRNLYLGGQAKDEEVRYSSSSGGIFSVLAQYVLSRGGVVYGAGYDKAMKVIHKGAENRQQLQQIKRTKYVQSNMEGIYEKIEKNLKENRWVLFTGTPCQAAALLRYLNRSYERLIVVDLICYGVPSPGIWKDYVNSLERVYRGKMTDFSFRDKRNRDNGHTCSCIIGGREYAISFYQNIYCILYFKNYMLRPSCHSCRFCTVDRKSDFTIGDFWGIERVRQEMDDGMGTSVIIAHSDKAKGIWDEVKEELNWFQCSKEDLLQPRLLQPTGIGRGRRDFLLLYKIIPFFRLTAKLPGKRYAFQRKKQNDENV